MPITLLFGLIGVTATFGQRMLDPLTPVIAASLGVPASQIVLLAPAMFFPFALAQPILGPIGDSFGKARVLKICIVLLSLAAVAGALAPNYETLFIARMIGGAAAGGVIPTSIAIIADRFPVAERQIALSRFMTVMTIGQLSSAPVSAFLSEASSWRVAMGLAAVLAMVGFGLAMWQIAPRPGMVRPPFSLAGAFATYRRIIADRRAKLCFATVFCEGALVLGFTPHLALHIKDHGLGGSHETAYVIAAQGVGGLVFATAIGFLAHRFTRHTLMRAGGVMIGLGMTGMALAPSWQLMAFSACFSGFGFYMTHSGLQTEVTEVMPEARASSVSLHAFCFSFGLAFGPMIFGLIEDRVGSSATLIIVSNLFVVIVLICATLLARMAKKVPAGA